MSQIPSSFDNRRSSAISAFVNTRINWKKTKEAHIFKANIPGLKKEEVKVKVLDNRVLQISGERNMENDTWECMESRGGKVKWTCNRVKNSGGKFMRWFTLPENVKMESIKVSMENGVLTVTVPKEGTKETDVKAIEISG